MHSSTNNPESGKLRRAAGVVGFYTLLSRILGLVRDMVLAAFFGSGMAADAFFVAFRIPNLLRRLFAEGSLTIAFIPVFTEYLTRKSKEEAFDLARIVLTMLSLILVLVTILGILFSPWIVRIQAFGFGDSGIRYDLTVYLTRITFPYIFLIGLVAFFMGVLNSLRHFAAPAAAPIFLNLGIIASAFVISPFCGEPIAGVAVGVLIGGILQVLLQIPPVIRRGLQLFPMWAPSHPALKRIGLLMLPAIFGSAIYQVNQFVGTLIASFLPEGSISWLYYADRLVQFPLGIFAIALSTAALPSLSTQAAEHQMDRFEDTLNNALSLVFFITLPSMMGLIVLGEPMVCLFFERGAFTAHSSHMTSIALMYYAIGLWAFSGIRILVSAFYALQDTRTPVKVAMMTFVANVGLSLALMGPLQHGGLALALSASSAVQFFLLFFFLKRKGVWRRFQAVVRCTLLSSVASVLTGIVLFALNRQWHSFTGSEDSFGLLIRIGSLMTVGIVVYMGIAHALKIKEVSLIMGILMPLLTKMRKRGGQLK